MSQPMLMSCEEALRQLAAFLDDELHSSVREGVERHLETCRSCFSRAEFERRLKGEISQLRREAVTPDFEERVRRLLRAFAASSPGEAAGDSPA
jgi:anti-sigma factor (TIGR02949 family)